MIKSDNKMIQERHEALPDYVKKIDDIYVKKTGDFYVKPTKNQTKPNFLKKGNHFISFFRYK